MEKESDEKFDEKAILAKDSALLNILGNALSSSIKHEKSAAGLETKKCPNCSAARPADTDLQYCDYCGYKFY